MNLKFLNAALLSTVLIGAGLASLPAAAMNGLPGKVISLPGDPVDPNFGNWQGSYYTEQTVWGDGIEHTNEVGTTIRTVYYVSGITYQDCHNNLIAAASAAYAAGMTDCTQI